MAAAPSLTDLARVGFVDLSGARDLLVTNGFDPEWFTVAASADNAVRWLSRLADSSRTLLDSVLAAAEHRAALIRVLGVSDGLAEFLVRKPAALSRTLPPESLPTEADYRDAFSGVASVDDIRLRYREHLVTIAAWDLSQPDASAIVHLVGVALADLAGAVLDAALQLAKDTVDAPADIKDNTVLTIVGMGKAGARELNYVSDVDVVFVCDARGIDSNDAVDVATKWARSIVATVNEPSLEPALWELDTNLRPEGAKGALVRTLQSHVAYYERWAENWEFQAMLKARPMAGDTTLGGDYLAALSDVVWSSSAREGFVESVQKMRERVTENIPADLRDVQIKLGPGGLRDVEFTVQLLQLVHGKDDETVRVRDTLTAITRLSEGGYIGRTEAHSFSNHYRELRVLEHRVQLLALRRTHLMPRDPELLRIVARASGLAETSDALLTRWNDIKRDVRSLHQRLFYRPLLSAVANLGEETISLSSIQAEARLSASGFRDAAGALRHIGALTAGISRSAAIQRNLLPVLLHWMTEGTDPDGGLAAFRTISDSLGDSPWYLRMLRDSVGAAQRLSRVLSVSRYVAILIERVPDAVAWLDDDENLRPRTRETLMDEFGAIDSRHDNVEDAAKAVRFARRRELLRVALAVVLDLVDIEEAGVALSDIATATIDAATRLARRGIDGIEFAVIAMGRFGGRELGFSSDTDVVWVFRDSGAGDSAHQRAEKIVHSVIRLTEDLRFPLDLDAGLRPEGKNGPLVRSLEAYRAYYSQWSDIWETQALIRATPVAGDPALLSAFDEMADAVRYATEISEEGIREIRRIKARVETERLPFGADAARHAKLGRGSLSDVEWLVQLLQLQHGPGNAVVRSPSTLAALSAEIASGFVSETDGAALREAWLLSSRIRSATTLFTGKGSDVVPMDRPALEGIARLLGYPAGRGAELENDYLRVTRQSRQVFERIFYPT
jgi:glutamate-ammonia-ligase adenylyltransferase